MKDQDPVEETLIEEARPKQKTFGWIKQGQEFNALSVYLEKSRNEKDGKISLLYEIPVEG